MGHLPEREVCHMRRHIDFDKIGITDDVMFCTVLSNSEDCREFLQRILGIEIEEIVIVGTQVSMKSNFHAKGVRLDVYAKDKKGNAYDIEMQTTKMRELPLRSRYYHSEMDSYQIAAGEKYGNLKHSIVIFVCFAPVFLFSYNKSSRPLRIHSPIFTFSKGISGIALIIRPSILFSLMNSCIGVSDRQILIILRSVFILFPVFILSRFYNKLF